MKKTISAILVCILLVSSVFVLTSCGKTLSGKYKDALTSNVTYEFDIFGKVTKTTDNFIGEDTVTEGEYKINDDGDKITLTFDGESEEYDLSIGTEDGQDYIKIGLLKYNKVD